jgi:hypothetical protein
VPARLVFIVSAEASRPIEAKKRRRRMVRFLLKVDAVRMPAALTWQGAKDYKTTAEQQQKEPKKNRYATHPADTAA